MYTIVYKHKLYKYLLIVLLRSIIDEMFQSMKTDIAFCLFFISFRIICKDYRIQCLGHSQRPNRFVFHYFFYLNVPNIYAWKALHFRQFFLLGFFLQTKTWKHFTFLWTLFFQWPKVLYLLIMQVICTCGLLKRYIAYVLVSQIIDKNYLYYLSFSSGWAHVRQSGKIQNNNLVYTQFEFSCSNFF